MALKDTFSRDFDVVFANTNEFANDKTFEIIEDGLPKRFTTNVVWDTEELKNRMIVQQMGVYLGSVMMYINMKWFAIPPKAEQIIYVITQVGVNEMKIPWKVLEVSNLDDVYGIALDRLIS
jgi:hypothetical protein